MNRFANLCCAVVLLGSSTAAFAADAKATGRLALVKRGLAQFDLDGNGSLDGRERAAALAARRGVDVASSPSDSSTGSSGDHQAARPRRDRSSSAAGYQFSSAGYEYAGPSGFVYADAGSSYLSQDGAYLGLQGPRCRQTHYPIGPMAIGMHKGDPRAPNFCPSRFSDLRIIQY